MLERHFTAARINEIVNHPLIFPWICGHHTEPLDLTPVAANPSHVCLVGEHGCVLFIKHQPGVYEFHTSVLPEGRGQWMVDGARTAFAWMFTHTDAFELLTKCPDGNVASKAGARAVGCRRQFKTRPIWPLYGNTVPVDVYSILLQDWAQTAEGVIASGRDFHAALEAKYRDRDAAHSPHEDDEVHDRYVGITVTMIRHGQAAKAINFYNRWAVMSGYRPVHILSIEPLIIDIAEAKLKICNNDFEVM